MPRAPSSASSLAHARHVSVSSLLLAVLSLIIPLTAHPAMLLVHAAGGRRGEDGNLPAEGLNTGLSTGGTVAVLAGILAFMWLVIAAGCQYVRYLGKLRDEEYAKYDAAVLATLDGNAAVPDSHPSEVTHKAGVNAAAAGVLSVAHKV